MALILNARVFGFNLENEVAAIIQKYANEINVNSYLENVYKPELSKDPFWDVLESMESVSMEKKIGWLEAVKKALEMHNCGLDTQKIVWILYYFSDDFRAELTRSLKTDSWDFNSRNYKIDEDTLVDYCSEYYNCVNKGSQAWTTREISASTPKDPKTSCKEFFLQYYDAWSSNTQRSQNIKNWWAGFDKYWNATTDDSPYDIMSDMWVVWKLLFDDVEQPITPVLFHLPLFSNSQQALNDNKDSKSGRSGSSGGGSRSKANSQNKWWETPNNSKKEWDSQGSVSLNNITEKTKSQGQSDEEEESSSEWLSERIWWLDDGYDDMLEWLLSMKTKSNNSLFYGNACETDGDADRELELASVLGSEIGDTKDIEFWWSSSDKEYQEAVNFMLEAASQYGTLSDKEVEEIKKNMGEGLNINISEEAMQDIENTQEKVKNCRKSCDWLRVDQKASCMIMCACGEVKSPIFDPNVTPWLWPIFMIRFCAIPWVNHWFSVWWKKVMSIEEMLNEIYGVVDKLSSEWRLWTRTKQHNFLDSTTKNIKFGEIISFTVSVSEEKIFNKMPKQSKQYSDKVAESDNSTRQYDLGISNPLIDPATKNQYRVVGYEWEVVRDFSAEVNPEINKQAKEQSVSKSSSIFDQGQVSRADHYLQLSEDLSLWMDQQWYFWSDMLHYINEWRNYAEALYAKK